MIKVQLSRFVMFCMFLSILNSTVHSLLEAYYTTRFTAPLLMAGYALGRVGGDIPLHLACGLLAFLFYRWRRVVG